MHFCCDKFKYTTTQKYWKEPRFSCLTKGSYSFMARLVMDGYRCGASIIANRYTFLPYIMIYLHIYFSFWQSIITFIKFPLT